MTRGDPRSRRDWQRLRRYLIETTPRPVICWRCEEPISDPETAHLGHLTDLATAAPGTPLRVALEHPGCNLSAGGQLGAELQRRRRPAGPVPPWVSAPPSAQ